MLAPPSAERPDEQLASGASEASPGPAHALPQMQARENGATPHERPSVAPQDAPTQQQNERRSPQHNASTNNTHVGEQPPLADARNVENSESDAGQEANLQQARQQEADRSLPVNDQAVYYSDTDNDSVESEDDAGPSTCTNRGNKLHRKRGVRWLRRSKLGSWTEARAAHEVEHRADERVNAFQHINVESLLEAEASMPGGLGASLCARRPPKRRRGQLPWRTTKRPRNERGQFEPAEETLTPDEQISLRAATLGPSLLLPVMSARSLLESRTLRQTFRNPLLTALNHTAVDLRESESALYRAVGRCFGAMERVQDLGEIDMQVLTREEEDTAVHENEMSDALAAQEQDIGGADEASPADGGASTEARQLSHANGDTHYETGEDMSESRDTHAQKLKSPGPPDEDQSHLHEWSDHTPAMTQIERLFITPEGATVPIAGDAEKDDARSSGTTMLSMQEQREVLYASLECLNDLQSDSREYSERLNEVREMLGDIRRTRNIVWQILRQWALNRDEDDQRSAANFHERHRNAHPRADSRRVKASRLEYTQDRTDAREANTYSHQQPDSLAPPMSRSRSKKRPGIRA